MNLDQRPRLPGSETRRIYTVSEINSLVRDVLESSFFDLWVEGEVSNLRNPGSGHFYFTLKDVTSQIAAVLFRAQAAQLRFRLEDGLRVLVRGRLSLYEPRGTYQIQCGWMEPAGKGSLQLAFEQLKRRLEEEGLFDPARKRPLPALPQRIGVITSPTGAALRDFLHVLDRRYANVRVTIHPTRVQGPEAAPGIAEAIRRMNRIGAFDVLVVCRGGGSLEDLWPFNEEVVARAVADSRIPIVSAVGHEIDFTICDFVADLRAATPSAAAELVVARKEELEERIGSLTSLLKSGIRLHHQKLRERVARLGRSRALLSARRQVSALSQRLDVGREGLREALRARARDLRRRLEASREGISPRVFRAVLATRRERLAHHLRLSELAAGRAVHAGRERARSLASLLDSLSPLAVLDRGYALCLDPESGELVTDVGRLPASRRVDVRLKRGRIGCDIREVHDGPDGKKAL